MRWTSVGAAVVLLPLVLVAQQGAARYESAKAARDALSARLQRENQAYREARSRAEASEAFRKAGEQGDSKTQLRILGAIPSPDVNAMCREAIEVAARFEGDDAVRLLAWAAIRSRDQQITRDVVARIEKQHMESIALTDLLERADVIARRLGRQRGGQFLVQVAARSPHDLVKAWSLYWQAIAIERGQPEMAGQLRKKAQKLAGEHWLGDRLRGPEFRAQRLQVGMVAPDIAGEDLDGVAFQLSDYRGKVVVLDFWGFW